LMIVGEMVLEVGGSAAVTCLP